MTRTRSADTLPWKVAYDYTQLRTPLPQLVEYALSRNWLPPHRTRGDQDSLIEEVRRKAILSRRDPQQLLDGLSDSTQTFLAHLFTGRDPYLPFPAQFIENGWMRMQSMILVQAEFLEVVDELRHAHLLFPSQGATWHRSLGLSIPKPLFEWIGEDFGYPVQSFDYHVQPSPSASADALTQPASNFAAEFGAFLNALLNRNSDLDLQPYERIAHSLLDSPSSHSFRMLHGWELSAEDLQQINRLGWSSFQQKFKSIQVVAASALADETAAQLAEQLGQQPAQVQLYFELAAALQLIGLVKPEKDHLAARPDAGAMERWLSRDIWEQHRHALHAWQRLLYRAPEVETAQREAGFRIRRGLLSSHFFDRSVMAAEWCAMRRFVTRVLRGVPAMAWVKWQSLSEELERRYPYCHQSFTRDTQWWIESASVRFESHWQATNGAIIARMIRDALRWLGVADVQIHPDTKELIAFRVTETGAALIQPFHEKPPRRLTSDAALESPPVWLDDFTLRIPPSHAHRKLMQTVQRAAERTEQAFTYRFTASSLARARDADPQLLSSLEAELVTHASPVPAVLHERIRQTMQRSGRLRMYTSLAVVELADEQLARELFALELLQPHVVAQISPTAFLVTEASALELQKQLRRKGYHPRVQHSSKPDRETAT